MKAKLLLSVVVLVAAPLAAQQPQSITCSAQANSPSQVCPANTRDGVLLVREQSADVCRQGSTWTYDRRGITVSGGCSAEFLVSGRGGRGANQGNGYGNSGYNSNGRNDNSGYSNAQPNGNNGTQNYNGGANNLASQRSLTPLPQGTQIAMQLDQAVRVGELNQGDFVTGTMVNDLSVNGRVIAPAGTPLQAKVLSTQGGTLDLRLDSFHVNGLTYVVQTNSVHGLRDATNTGDTGTRGGIGAVLGSLANAGNLPAGTVFNFRLTATSRPTQTN